MFISYAHVDDLKYAGEGWVTQFATTLIQLLAREADGETIGELPLWIDQRMNAGDGIDPTIETAIADAAVFVPIVSTAYLRSKYCMRELDAFCRQNYKGRIVPVLIGTNGLKIELEPLKQALWAEFATFDKLEGRDKLRFKPKQYDADDPYWKAIESVARNIGRILKERREQASRLSVPLARVVEDYSTAFPVYLAEAADDLFDQREALREMLASAAKSRGSAVEPPSPLFGASDVVEACRAALGRSALSIHLIGTLKGRPAGNSEKPLAHRELDEAVARRPKFRPIVWMPPEAELDIQKLQDATQKAAAQSVLERARGGEVELIRTGFQKFYEEMQRRLCPPVTPAWKKERVQSNLLVYVAHCGNQAAALKVIADLKASGCRGATYLNHCGNAKAEELHRANLELCDGFVIVYDPATLTWALRVAQQTWKSSGSGDGPRLIAALESEASGGDFGFQSDNLYAVPPMQLTEFVEKLRNVSNG